MIRYKPQCVASSRDDAISYLFHQLEIVENEGWKKLGDINVTIRRNPAGGRTYVASTLVGIDEGTWEARG